MMEQVAANAGALPPQMSGDAGFFSTNAVTGLMATGVEPFIPPDKVRHGARPLPAPRGRIPKDLPLIERMWRKLRTKRGMEVYALRMETVEPVLGQIKQARGFRQFLLRGLRKASGEWGLICTGHNLLKLFGALTNRLVRGGSPTLSHS